MRLLVLLRPPEGVESAVFGDHSVPLGVGVDHRQDAGTPGKRVPSGEARLGSGLGAFTESRWELWQW